MSERQHDQVAAMRCEYARGGLRCDSPAGHFGPHTMAHPMARADSPSVQVTFAKAEVALRAKAAGTSNPAYQRHLLKFLRLLDWARS